MKKILFWLGIAALIVLLFLLISWPFMALWNYVMPVVFGLTTINFKQALALLIIAHMLFYNGSNTK